MTKKTTIRFPSDLFRRLKDSAKRNRRSMSAELVILLDAALEAEMEGVT
ncbi:MAG: Arc family DNA-binding protein [Pseudorhodobacter sp.]|nr:Arc family DNA-binding protein [Pseudorhodobacter sp.]